MVIAENTHARRDEYNAISFPHYSTSLKHHLQKEHLQSRKSLLSKWRFNGKCKTVIRPQKNWNLISKQKNILLQPQSKVEET